MSRLIFQATLVCGTLDIFSAFVFAGVAGRGPAAVLYSVASGPFGGWPATAGLLGAGVGLVVHFAIMTAMTAAFIVAARHIGLLTAHPVASGVIYGLLLYAIMYWIVLPLRWPTAFPQTGAWDVSNAIFSHLACVGLPLSFMTAWKYG